MELRSLSHTGWLQQQQQLMAALWLLLFAYGLELYAFLFRCCWLHMAASITNALGRVGKFISPSSLSVSLYFSLFLVFGIFSWSWSVSFACTDNSFLSLSLIRSLFLSDFLPLWGPLFFFPSAKAICFRVRNTFGCAWAKKILYFMPNEGRNCLNRVYPHASKRVLWRLSGFCVVISGAQS